MAVSRQTIFQCLNPNGGGAVAEMDERSERARWACSSKFPGVRVARIGPNISIGRVLVKRIAITWSVAVLFCAFVPPLQADSGTRVTSGALMFASHGGVVDVAGQSGFRLRARVDDVEGRFDAGNQCGDFDCAPGTVVGLFAEWSGSDLNGTVAFKDQSYVLGREGAGGALGLVTFDGNLTLPPFNDAGVVDIDAPFTFSGQVEFEDTGVTEPLSGTGIATLQFTRSADGTAWQFSNATYALQRRATTAAP
jgi:hypothetical protein